MPSELSNVRLGAPSSVLPELASFYGGSLGLPLTRRDDGRLTIEIGESVLELAPCAGSPFYHFAFLVPGDRFEAALAWARDRVELLPDRRPARPCSTSRTGTRRRSTSTTRRGSIVELIAHRGIGEAGATGPFAPSELLGISEIGLVCDPPSLAEALERELGLEVWDGTVEGEGRLAFVGEKARTLILCRAGRPWLPTGRPAEAHPVEVTLSGASDGTVALDDRGRVSVTAS